MATEYALNLKANLDTSDVQQKLQQLGQTGVASTGQLEQAVKSLEQSIKHLTDSWKTTTQEQTKAAFQMQRMLRGGGAYLAGRALSLGAQYAQSQGATGIAGGLNVAGGALKGAGAGAVMGSAIPVVGTGIGAAIGATVGALESLAEAAVKSAQALQENYKNSEQYLQAQRHSEDMQKRIEAAGGMSAEDRANRRAQLEGTIAEYRKARENAATQYKTEHRYIYGASGSITPGMQIVGKESYQVVDEEATIKVAEQLKKLETAAKDAEIELQTLNAADKAAADAANEEAQKRKKAAEEIEKAAEAERKAAEAAEEDARKRRERTAEAAGNLLQSELRQQGLEQFGQSLDGKSVEELQTVVDDLKTKFKAAQQKYLAQLAETAETGEGGLTVDDLKTTRDGLKARLNMASSALGSLVDLDGDISSPSSSSLQQLMNSTMSSEAAKGYDVGGYAKLEDALWKQQIQISQKTEYNTERVAVAVERQTTAVEEIKNKLQNGNLASTWG